MRALFRVAAAFVAIVLLSGPGRLWARPPVVTPPAVAAERDELIDKLARGEDAAPSLARFIVLYKEQATLREAAQLAEQQERDRQQRERDQRQRDQQDLSALQHTLDYLVARH